MKRRLIRVLTVFMTSKVVFANLDFGYDWVVWTAWRVIHFLQNKNYLNNGITARLGASHEYSGFILESSLEKTHFRTHLSTPLTLK